jgi:hypothetical protein
VVKLYECVEQSYNKCTYGDTTKPLERRYRRVRDCNDAYFMSSSGSSP